MEGHFQDCENTAKFSRITFLQMNAKLLTFCNGNYLKGDVNMHNMVNIPKHRKI